VQLRAPRSFQGKTLAQLKLRTHYRVNLIGIKRQVTTNGNGNGTKKRERNIAVPGSDETIQGNDILVLVGDHQAIAELPQE